MPPKKQVIGESGINFNELNRVVNDQLSADAKYDRENDAKFRAVKQRVATYEEFENIVIGAHLKPMKEDVRDLDLKRSSWDSSGRARERAREKERKDALAVVREETSSTRGKRVTRNGQDFRRNWKSCKANDDKYRYLLEIGSDAVSSLFKSGVDDFLGPFVETLNHGYCADDCWEVVKFLSALSSTPRFGLALDMMDDSELDAVKALVGKIEHDMDQSSRDDSPTAVNASTLRSTYLH